MIRVKEVVSISDDDMAGCQAALNHIEVSNALHIIGMLVPKLGLMPFFGTATLGAGFGTALALLLTWAVSAARSHDPNSWERATEKNRNT